MVDIREISTRLKLAEDGIWYSTNVDSISYPSKGNCSCFAIEENSFWFRHRNNCIASVVKSYPPENNGTIFDIGGGNGFVSLILAEAGHNVTLVEPGRVGAANAKKRGIENVICATTNTAEFKQNSLSAVGLFDVVEHIKDDLAFLTSVRELMKENAPLYVTVPSYPFLWSAEDVFSGHFRRYALGNIVNILKLAGFQVEFSSYFFRFLPLPIFLLRTLPYKFGVSKRERVPEATSRDHSIACGVSGTLLDLILKTEIVNLNNRNAMSFGGSCVIVAKTQR